MIRLPRERGIGRTVAIAVAINVAALAWAGGAGCIGPKNPDPAAERARVALEVLHRIDELQATTIALNESGELADASAIRIVRFTVSSAEVLRAVPDGWPAVLLTSYDEARPYLANAPPKIAAFLSILDRLLGYSGGALP